MGWLPYAIPNSARDTHLYCIGSSGTGKSKFLESLFVQDVLAGRGCGLVDPHGDLARDVLANLVSRGYFGKPENLERVIYFDPTRSDYTIEFNVLKSHLPPYTLANQVIESFRRTWPQSLKEAPRFTNIALASLLVLIEAKRTLIDLPRLLTDTRFREELLTEVADQNVVDFFHQRYPQWGRGIVIESVLNKATAFTLNPHLRRCLGTPNNILDLRQIMNSGQVLIVNLGNCDDETRRLVGSLITTGFEQAAISRGEERRHFYLYLDEFQDFCANEGGTQTLAKVLSECRKFNLHLHLAHQTLGQIEQRVQAALGNVNIKVVFAVDYNDAWVFAHKLFVDYIGKMGWDQATAFIQKLPRQTMLLKWGREPLIRLKTTPIAPYQATSSAVEALAAKLGSIHGVTSAEIPRISSQVTTGSLSDWEH